MSTTSDRQGTLDLAQPGYNRFERRGTPMVFYNASTRELTAKIVYYGPGLCGKTTNLQVLHRRLDPGTAGELLALSTETDRTIYFDLLPVELGDIKGYTIRFQLATVPGQTAFNETRRIVLKGADGVVFVADSQWTMLPKNLESWQSLKENLAGNGTAVETIPVVIQYNKRDLPDILSVDAMQEALGFSSYPQVEAVASEGRGVTETFKLISKLTFLDLLRRLQGRAPAEGAGAVTAGNPEAAGEPAAPPADVAQEERRPPLTLVRSVPESTETAPETESAAPQAAEPEPLEPPFAEAVEGGSSPALAELEEKISALEKRLEEQARAAESSAARLEQRIGEAFGHELSSLERRMGDRLRALEDRFDAEASRSRGAGESLFEELGRLRERTERLEEQTSALARDLSELQHTLSETAAQSHREPEELKLQLAPLLEERVRREADENWTAEIERLRQALAESLDDLSERVRKAVRG
jgi:signal recognition particle receptor subunit beta/chaperonin cofactor prefoldin